MTMLSIEAYQDLIIDLLVRQHGYSLSNVTNRLSNDPIIPHCHINGRDPVKIAASLASKWKRWHQP
jgi:hypothetical protein